MNHHQDPVRDDRALLARAVDLATRGPLVDPNPRVGCVIVDSNGQVAGEGWHRGAGTPHAEVVALAAAGERARGGTAYVSLEPCRHTGRTGPCTQALIAAGVARVVFAAADPNPEAGGGAAELRSAGIAVSFLELPEAAALNEAWTFAMRHGRPRVLWKTATTLDGRSAAADGTSQWITAPETRALGHRLRAECGAILVGTGTALADDPALTVRLDQTRSPASRVRMTSPCPDKPVPPSWSTGCAGDSTGTRGDLPIPLRVVLGERELPAAARLNDDSAPTLHLRHRDPARTLATLHERGVRQVFLEGGPTLAAAFLNAGLIDRIVFHLAPKLLGAGATLGDFGVATIADAQHLSIRSVTSSGPDLIIVADLDRPRIEGDSCLPA